MRFLIACLFALAPFCELGAAPFVAPRQAVPPASSVSPRYLFLIDNSSSMARQKQAIADTVCGLLLSEFDGQAVKGDGIGLWFFNNRLHKDVFRAAAWSDEKRVLFTEEVAAFLRELKFEKRRRMEGVWEDALEAVRGSEEVTLFILSDGETPLRGTPFDAEVNAIFQEHGGLLRRAQKPFVTALLARRGTFAAWSVSTGGGAIPVPRFSQAAFVSEPLARKAKPIEPDASKVNASAVKAPSRPAFASGVRGAGGVDKGREIGRTPASAPVVKAPPPRADTNRVVVLEAKPPSNPLVRAEVFSPASALAMPAIQRAPVSAPAEPEARPGAGQEIAGGSQDAGTTRALVQADSELEWVDGFPVAEEAGAPLALAEAKAPRGKAVPIFDSSSDAAAEVKVKAGAVAELAGSRLEAPARGPVKSAATVAPTAVTNVLGRKGKAVSAFAEEGRFAFWSYLAGGLLLFFSGALLAGKARGRQSSDPASFISRSLDGQPGNVSRVKRSATKRFSSKPVLRG